MCALRQEIDAILLDAEASAEGEPALGHRLRGVVEHRGSGMTHFRRAPAGPGQTVVFAVARPADRLQGGAVEGVLVGHLPLQPLWRLARIADGPHAAVYLAQSVLDRGLLINNCDVLEHLLGKAELLGEAIDDFVIGTRLKQWLDHLLAPLEGAVGGGHRAIGLELRRSRQQIDAVSTVVHHRAHGRIGIDHHQGVELGHRLLHVG